MNQKRAKPNAQDDKSTIVKTKVGHITCKLHWCGKTDFTKHRRIRWNSWVLLGLSCAFMVAQWCSSVFAWLFGCLVVCLIDFLIVFKTPPIF